MGENIKDSEEKMVKHGHGSQDTDQQPNQLQHPLQSSTVPASSSLSSSPSHEFSFTISLHHPKIPAGKSKPPSSIAVDLSPADDIFFHGHLLPLHLFPNLPVSPRTSCNFLEYTSTIPVRELSEDQNPNESSRSSNSKTDINDHEITGKPMLNPFSLFGISRWRKKCEGKEDEDKKRNEKRPSLDVTYFLKKFMRMIMPSWSFGERRRRRNVNQFHHQSYSGTLSLMNKQALRGRRKEFSAPASIRTSPTNSGILTKEPLPLSKNNSSMDELQAAIQAAIDHCKNSAMDADQNKFSR